MLNSETKSAALQKGCRAEIKSDLDATPQLHLAIRDRCKVSELDLVSPKLQIKARIFGF